MHRQPDQAQDGWTPLTAPAQADTTVAGTKVADTTAAGTTAAGTTAAGTTAKAETVATTVTVPVSLLAAAEERVAPEPAAPEPGGRTAGLREQLAEVRRRAAGATSWLESSEHYERLLNSEGFVAVTARFDARDLKFLGRAREDLLAFAELGLRLADLHRPLDAGGTTSDPANPALRCRSCMWRWPCPTLRLMTEILSEPDQGMTLAGPR